ncbi:MAG: hypothetical protein NZ937_00340 [Armatimonadetes bacterium]|nr:hypothetical protein [Armatimonadota bacterium]
MSMQKLVETAWQWSITAILFSCDHRECPVLFACNGGCPKDRFIKTPDGENGLNYLCAGYKRFFTYIDSYMRLMANLLRQGQPAWLIMETLLQKERPKQKLRPNEP